MAFEAAAMHAAFSAEDEQMSLIYSMLMSVDGYVEDEHGRFDFAAPDEEVNGLFLFLRQAAPGRYYGCHDWPLARFPNAQKAFSCAQKATPMMKYE